jgi:hypothetical protein
VSALKGCGIGIGEPHIGAAVLAHPPGTGRNTAASASTSTKISVPLMRALDHAGQAQRYLAKTV